VLVTEIKTLTGLIYDAALDAAYSPELLEKMVGAFRGCNATFGIAAPDLQAIPRFDSLTPPEILAGYQAEMTEDPWCKALIDGPQSGAFLGTDLVDQHEYRRSETYRRFNKPCDIEYLAIVAAFPRTRTPCWLTVNRTRRQGDFSAEDRRVLRYLHRHVSRAGLLSWYDTIPADAEIISGPGGVDSISSDALHLVGESPSLDIDANGIRSTDRSLDRKPQEAVSRTSHTGEVVELELPVVDRQHARIVVRVAPRRNSKSLRTTLFIRPGIDSPEQSATDVLDELYRLTPSEAAIVFLLCQGQSVAQIARHRGTSRDAVRFHLKNVFQKLHVARQSELVSRVSAGPTGFLLRQKRTEKGRG